MPLAADTWYNRSRLEMQGVAQTVDKWESDENINIEAEMHA